MRVQKSGQRYRCSAVVSRLHVAPHSWLSETRDLQGPIQVHFGNHNLKQGLIRVVFFWKILNLDIALLYLFLNEQILIESFVVWDFPRNRREPKNDLHFRRFNGIRLIIIKSIFRTWNIHSFSHLLKIHVKIFLKSRTFRAMFVENCKVEEEKLTIEKTGKEKRKLRQKMKKSGIAIMEVSKQKCTKFDYEIMTFIEVKRWIKLEETTSNSFNYLKFLQYIFHS